jgi:hypothetical protein
MLISEFILFLEYLKYAKKQLKSELLGNEKKEENMLFLPR